MLLMVMFRAGSYIRSPRLAPQIFYLMDTEWGIDDYDGAMYSMINFTALYIPVAYGTVE